MLTVEKIGGTCMTALHDVMKNIVLYGRENENLYNRIFVVSAFSGVTNWLLENKKTGEPGVYHHITQQKDFHKPLKETTEKLQEINKKYVDLGLDLKLADEYIANKISQAEKFLENLANVLASGYVSSENILQASREILASLGESHSAFVFANILQKHGINATLIDLGGFDDHYPFTIDQRIEHSFKDIDFSKTICVVTGYTKGTEGIMREFDRGYSEVTFCKIAVAVKPQEAIIHKEYHLSSADPNIVGVENCIPVCNTNYDVADQLADVGMEAIHPKASKPLEMMGIDLRIKNAFEPEHPGTLITREYISPKKKVDVITGTPKAVIIEIFDPLMVGAVGSDLKIMQKFESYKVSYIFKATSANSISMVIWEKDFKQKLVDELEKEYQKVAVEKVAIVCMIGSNMDQPGVLGKAAGALAEANVNIKSAGFSLRKVNLQFIVNREDFNKSIIALNKTMFFEPAVAESIK
ncbi:MAG: aspartate kinase [Sporocytophaga sp.]|uniref:aspartate kinase n=1 Tax=Sporocytophaga sp. TaxID=2231183 RepID=UPI001B0995FF|nr:aspartate kinase [Sporocytophaga sp.]MBO9702623.1 aspartate kinase [Sporocytophaga sp.]